MDGHGRLGTDGHGRIGMDGHGRIGMDGHGQLGMDGHGRLGTDGHGRLRPADADGLPGGPFGAEGARESTAAGRAARGPCEPGASGGAGDAGDGLDGADEREQRPQPLRLLREEGRRIHLPPPRMGAGPGPARGCRVCGAGGGGGERGGGVVWDAGSGGKNGVLAGSAQSMRVLFGCSVVSVALMRQRSTSICCSLQMFRSISSMGRPAWRWKSWSVMRMLKCAHVTRQFSSHIGIESTWPRDIFLCEREGLTKEDSRDLLQKYSQLNYQSSITVENECFCVFQKSAFLVSAIRV
jgi:hypothetical protein